MAFEVITNPQATSWENIYEKNLPSNGNVNETENVLIGRILYTYIGKSQSHNIFFNPNLRDITGSIEI
jgi:hypothetical protein